MLKKYLVQIARNETTIYTVEAQGKNEEDAEANAYKKWADGDYISSKVVYGEEETYDIQIKRRMEVANA